MHMLIIVADRDENESSFFLTRRPNPIVERLVGRLRPDELTSRRPRVTVM